MPRPLATRRGVVVAASALVITIVAGASVAVGAGLASTSSTASSPRAADVGAAFIGGGITESKFVPITPCRIVDSRVAGGKVAAGASRGFLAGGVDLSGQGGKAGGCGIPGSATALEATISAVAPSGAGYLSVGPGDGPVPNASFVYYRTGNVANTGTFMVAMAAPHAFTIKAHSAATQVVVDVYGYYEAPMAAYVSSTATLVAGRSSRVVSAQRASGYTAGGYEVAFDRDVSNCMYTVVPYSGNAFMRAQPRSAKPNSVLVLAALPSNSAVSIDTSFHITVTC